MKKASLLALITAIAGLTIYFGAHAAPPSSLSTGKTLSPARAALPPLPAGFPKIDRKPSSHRPEGWVRGVMDSIPTYNPASTNPWQMDLRTYDVSRLDLSRSQDNLMFASFDTRTKWPDAKHMPGDFDRQRIADTGRNPGLGIRRLHSRGITGRGVGIAIIDQTLLVDHREYRDQLRMYEELDDIQGGWLEAQMHGPAVSSIAVGKTVGVAPEADLYYIATAFGGEKELDFTYLARAVRRILEVNRQLPEGRRIRVISMAIGWGGKPKGHEDITAAAEEAKAEGMLVICSSVEAVHGFRFHGLGRSPLANPDRSTSYEPGMWWAKSFSDGRRFSDRLLVPMDSRTTAGPGGVDDYAFYRQGGWSWSIPYIAGMYALAAQVKPSITPD
ncbi:MAG: S8 family serine peptidase, partial [Candidatus Latescibacterota bacterium]